MIRLKYFSFVGLFFVQLSLFYLTPGHWYKSTWAFLIYGFVFFFTLFLARGRSRKLLQEKNNLEKAFAERTKELFNKNRQLEHMEQQNLQLREQSTKLKELDRLKSRFFANISHEFRTPLTLIMGSLDHLRFNSRDQETEQEIKVILRNSQQLLTLINQLLDLAQFDSGKMKLKAAPQDMIPFLKGIIESFHFFALQNRLDLVFDTEEESIILYFDAEKLEKVMINLLANAIKFTPPGGKITVKLTRCRNGGLAEISVVDTGIGIPSHQLPHIFDRFYQAGGPLGGEERKGTGIGLALSKELISLHHGRINVHSTIAKGTEFVIRLPMGDRHLKPEEINQNSSLPYKTPLPVLPLEKEEKVNPAAKKESKEKDLVLVVEDNSDMRKFLREPLEDNFNVIEAVNGQEGIRKARTTIPDLIISDIMMPGADGYELCRVLKEDSHTRHIPIILLTAKASEESMARGLETRADDYIIKPFNTKLLSLRIKNLILQRRQLKEKIEQQQMLEPHEIPVSSMETVFLKEVQEIIEKNLSDPEFNVDQLAGKLYMSRSGLYKKMHALIGESPVEFIRTYRLKRAAQLLKTHFGNVTEVALEVGFSSVAYFTKCFKELFQQLPSAFLTDKVPGD